MNEPINITRGIYVHLEHLPLGYMKRVFLVHTDHVYNQSLASEHPRYIKLKFNISRTNRALLYTFYEWRFIFRYHSHHLHPFVGVKMKKIAGVEIRMVNSSSCLTSVEEGRDAKEEGEMMTPCQVVILASLET